jgi:hypothetical protein
MPTPYELWLAQHGFQEVQQIQVLEFIHPAVPQTAAVTDYGQEIRVQGSKVGGAYWFTAYPVAFTLDRPQSGQSTQQDLTIKMDALGGRVVSYIRQLNYAQRQVPMQVVYRIFLDNDLRAPVMDPVLFQVRDVSAARLVTEIHCTVTTLPNVIAGIRYTLETFPTLAYV